MNVVFPLGFPSSTAFYLTLYVLTFVLHQVFMHYVLAGSLYVSWAAACPGCGSRSRIDQPLAAILRDWMPFLLSAAITAGVAPLLFIQIVYQSQFYTANLLLWWRWMLIVPVLIVAFYLLYLLKSAKLWHWQYAVRVTVSMATAASFVFVGFCWTVNHLLANNSSKWPEVYATEKFPIVVSVVLCRMLVWIGGSFTTMSVIVGWQLYYRQKLLEGTPSGTQDPVDDSRRSVRTLSGLGIGGLTVALVAGIASLIQCDTQVRGMVIGPQILPYVLLTIVGMIAQGIGWSLQWRVERLNFLGLTAATVGTLISLLGVSVIREGLRISAIDLVSLAQRHADAAKVGGFGVFVGASIIVTCMIAWCVRLVRHGIGS